MRADKHFLAGQSIPSRRHYPRVETPNEVWVYWNCKGREDTSQVRDLSMVQEGQIRAEAVVRHVKPGRGLGLKFTALTEEDGPRLTALMTRLRSLSQSRTNPK